ncbi:MAG: nickel pincer cofactor biosynthesis protein LarC [Desulfovibrio sp.]|uniref:nickel pincer cofactor biosynthesis protein LarC n=1 Tax=Desulfovibrio sp. 7SRBS1 TaxID=3378064 RepID=UPI003B3D8A89
MNILYYECFAGISGDMNLAAMIDLGVEPDYLRTELSKLGLDDEFELCVSQEFRSGIRGTRVDVLLNQEHDHTHDHPHAHDAEEEGGHHHHHQPHGKAKECGHAAFAGHDHAHSHDHPHEHHHGHDHEYHAHGHEHDHGHGHGHTHTHNRNLGDIEAIIMGSSLDDAVKETSLRIFRRVAEAEGHVHGKPIEEVHFHEVGATDSIVDIVGAAICFHRLGVDAVWASSVELGGGVVHCVHGVMPVPAPATVEILHGIPTTRGRVQFESTTPTGAAILAALVDEFTDAPVMETRKTGYGIGHKESEMPNFLRVHLAAVSSSGGARLGGARLGGAKSGGANSCRARLLQCNIDDMTGEHLGDAMELLLEQGAMDVHFSSIMMKKNRPGTMLSLLCAESDEERFKELLFRHTTTLGIKSFALEKTELQRTFEPLDTPLGSVTMKNALWNGKVVRSKPEFEECRELARKNGLTLAEVYALIAKQG